MKKSTQELLMIGGAVLALFSLSGGAGQGSGLAGLGAVRRRRRVRARKLTVSPNAGQPATAASQNYIVNPANGNIITEQRYQQLYPWTNLANWQYDQASGLWTDLTPH